MLRRGFGHGAIEGYVAETRPIRLAGVLAVVADTIAPRGGQRTTKRRRRLLP
jgi:hypothetical protein